MSNTVYVMCGVPGSGKSTFVDLVLRQDTYTTTVSRDQIRLSLVSRNEPYFSKEKEVFNKFISEIIANLNDGYDVIADATHITKSSRAKLLNRLPRCYDYEVIWLDTPLQKCIENNENRKGTRGFVPPAEIMKMYDKFEKPKLCEGFNRLHIIRPGEKPLLIV